MHPDDALARGLATGAESRVSSRSGAVTVPIRTTDEMMRGVVSLPHGYGHTDPGAKLAVASERQPGQNANALTDEEALDTISGTSVANGIPVDVEAVDSVHPPGHAR